MVQKNCVEILNTMFLNSICVIYTLTLLTGFSFYTIYYYMFKNFIQLLLTPSDSELTLVHLPSVGKMSPNWKWVALKQTSSSYIIESTFRAYHSLKMLLVWSLFLITSKALSTGTFVNRFTITKLTKLKESSTCSSFIYCLKCSQFFM